MKYVIYWNEGGIRGKAQFGIPKDFSEKDYKVRLAKFLKMVIDFEEALESRKAEIIRRIEE